MKPKLIPLLALVLVAGRISHSMAADTGQIYRNEHYGFQLTLPRGWTATETNFEVFHYNDVFLTINNRRPDLTLREQPVNQNTIEYNGNIVVQQMQPGEAYVSIGYCDGPGGPTMASDDLGGDLLSLLQSKRFTACSEWDLSEVDLSFFKRGHFWNISAYLRQPVTDAVSNQVMAILDSFRFVDAPIGNAAWAESLAWKELPENIRNFADWPVSDNLGWRPVYGRTSVVVDKTNENYSVQFSIMNGFGIWNYTVSTDGNVRAGPVFLPALNPPRGELPPDLPGEVQGKVTTYWQDPYVLATKAFGKTTITRFDSDDHDQRPTGANTNRASYVEYDVKQGWMGLHIFHNGSLVSSFGPFVACYPDYGPAVNDDGSAALLVWKDQSKTRSQVVVFNTNGDIRFQTDCGRDVFSPIVAPGGVGALVRPNGGPRVNTFMWFTKKGKERSVEINWNPEFIGWIPNTQKSLFATSVGFEYQYQLIDWDTGKRLWKIDSPGERALGIAVTPTLLILCVDEPSPQGVWHKVNQSLLQSGNEWVRTFYAVNVENGKFVAHWRGQFPHRWFDTDYDHFSRMGGKLFYVTADEFTEINIGDILAKKNGWQ